MMQEPDVVTEISHPGKFLTLLISLVFLILVAPVFVGTGFSAAIFNFILVIVLVAAVYTLRHNKRDLYISGSLAILTAITLLLDLYFHATVSGVFDAAFLVLFFGYISWTIFLAVLRGKQISHETIYGALSVYLLLAILFGTIYIFIERLAPGSFQWSSVVAKPHGSITNFKLIYYSFSTITTVGFGDILAISTYAKAFSMIEMVTGVFYLAALVARLVTGFSILHR